jgi:hypothetical protein
MFPDTPRLRTDIDMVYSVDLETGQSQEFAGMNASATIGWIHDAGALVMYEWEDTIPETTDYRVFDPVTGEQLGTIEDAPSSQVSARTLPTVGRNSISVSSDGSVEIIALGTQHIYAFVAGDNGMVMQRIESPEGLLSNIFLAGNVYVSPDGSMLALNGEEDEGRVHYLIVLDDPDAKWQSYMPETVGERGRNLLNFAEGTD